MTHWKELEDGEKYSDGKKEYEDGKKQLSDGEKKSSTAKSSLPLQRSSGKRGRDQLQQPSSRPQTASQ